MTGFDPIKGPRTTGCIYLEEQPDGRYECLIRTGEVDLDGLSENVKSYYLRECLPYPDPQDSGHQPSEHHLPEKCGYRMVEA